MRHMAEYTTFREDSYRCGHRPDAVRFTTDIGVDARRRDFSVNALYRRLYDGKLGPVIDPTGGQKHLEQGVLHTVTPDPDRVLRDDGLRILRAARFQAELDLAPTPALLDSSHGMRRCSGTSPASACAMNGRKPFWLIFGTQCSSAALRLPPAASKPCGTAGRGPICWTRLMMWRR